MENNGHTIRIGDMFADREKWIDNSFEIRYSQGSFIVQYNLSSPQKNDVNCFGVGALSLGLYVVDNIIFFCFKIDGFTDWSDQAFSIRLLEQSEQVVPDVDNKFVPITFVLVDADTGVVRKLRVATMSPHMSGVLFKNLRQQIADGFNLDAYMKKIDQVYDRMPTSALIASAAQVMERLGSRHQ